MWARYVPFYATEVGKMTTFNLWPIPWGGGAWGAGTNMWHPETPASYESLPAPLATQIPTLWIHTSGGGAGGRLWYYIHVEHSTYLQVLMPTSALLAYAQCMLATIFHFELAPKQNSCFRIFWGPLEGVKIAFFAFSLFSLVKTWLS